MQNSILKLNFARWLKSIKLYSADKLTFVSTKLAGVFELNWYLNSTFKLWPFSSWTLFQRAFLYCTLNLMKNQTNFSITQINKIRKTFFSNQNKTLDCCFVLKVINQRWERKFVASRTNPIKESLSWKKTKKVQLFLTVHPIH